MDLEQKVKEYTALLDTYKWMLAQSGLNRGGDATLMRLTRLKLEQLKKEIDHFRSVISDQPTPGFGGPN